MIHSGTGRIWFFPAVSPEVPASHSLKGSEVRAFEHRGRTYDATSLVEADGVYRGVFDIDSTNPDETDGVINEATEETFPTQTAAEQAADAAAKKWIDAVADKN